MGQKRIAGRSAQIQEKGTVRAEDSQDFTSPVCAPEEEGFTGGSVVIAAIFDSQVVRRGGDDQIDALLFKFGHAAEAIAMVELE